MKTLHAIRTIFATLPARLRLRMLFSLLASAGYLLISYLSAYWLSITESVSQSGALEALWRPLAVVVALFLLISALEAFFDYLGETTVHRGSALLKLRLYDVFCAEDPLNGSAYPLDKKIPLLAADSQEAVRAVYAALVTVATFCFQSVGSTILLFGHSSLLGVTSIVIGLIALLFNGGFSPLSRRKNLKLRAAVADASSELETIVKGSEVIKSFSLQDYFRGRYCDKTAQTYKYGMENMRLSLVSSSFAEISKYFIGGAFLAVAAVLCAHDLVPVSTMLFAYSLGNTIGWSMRRLGKGWMALQFSLAAAERVADALDTPAEPAGASLAPAKDALAIEFDGVSFSYGDNEVLRDLSFRIEAGQRVVLVGGSGSGKTTITKLCMRFLAPTSGTVRVMGQDTMTCDPTQLRECFGYVPQSPYIFGATVYDNIACAVDDASLSQVREVCARTAVDEFLDPAQGLDQELTEGGGNLSGGQRQRIAMARALIKDAPILIMDEYASALDSKTERILDDTIHALGRDKTVLAITHRLQSAKRYDRILVLENGRVVQDGTFATLAAQPEGLFCKLLNRKT